MLPTGYGAFDTFSSLFTLGNSGVWYKYRTTNYLFKMAVECMFAHSMPDEHNSSTFEITGGMANLF